MNFVNSEAAEVSKEQISFGFGANWQRFLAKLDESAVEQAVRSFREFTKIESLRGESFLDVGCGSGLSSLVAIRLGADRVVSVDIDSNSVRCTEELRRRESQAQDRWTVRTGSALDRDFLESLGRFSYVYSFGVLHHTGQMWNAIENVVTTNVAPSGKFHIAIYNEHKTSERWLSIKRWCNRWPHTFRPIFKASYITLLLGKMSLTGRSPIRFVREYDQHRGMNFFRDVDDWIAGLPYEYCSSEALTNFMAQSDYVLERIRTTNSCGCNEFLYHQLPNRGARLGSS